MIKNKKDTEIPTYCKGCSFKCQATGCGCICHDKMREYWESRQNER